ncbi:hypothetical protein EV644_103645 [Kribbella orskensis]|uniref:Uncharacterized protein n=1 Tax=Kribbella orskensis TaxID=2512216 RepID=A0ABY2BRF8_9ACTN|nr:MULTISPECIES: hypothetical protein [Kribbella]TCN37151.1 hypothetical protein EV642_11217 [Kribbella sp. VKM Ac-2500]TCO27941.1 hypothetical protein EV644_103645 [Kribbella orskensis]
MSARFAGLGAALIAVLAFLSPTPAAAAPPELPDQIAAAWKTDRIYIHGSMRPAFPKAELDRIRAASRTVDFPVYVALLPRVPSTRELPAELPTLLQARLGQPGLYLVWTVSNDYWSGTEKLVRPGGLKGRELVGVQLDDEQDNRIVTDRPAPRIVRTIQQAATAYYGRPLPEVPAGDLREDTYSGRSGRSTTDKEDLSAFIGMGVGGVLGVIIVILLTVRSRRKRPAKDRQNAKARRGNGRGKAGQSGEVAAPREPVSVSAVRTQADRWISKADKALRGLESRIKASRDNSLDLLDRRDDAARRLDAARTLRSSESVPATAGDPSGELTAAAGAFVLARQAWQVAGDGTVQPPCFFDPTHQPGTVQAAWSEGTEVPACPNCARLLERGETPRGFLVWKKSGLFGMDQSAVPYWTLDPKEQPLVATGFGSLEDDLAERVGRQEDK